MLISCVSQNANPPNALPVPALLADPIRPPHTLASLNHTLETTFVATSIQVVKAPDYAMLILPSYYAFINPKRINKFFKPDLLALIEILKAYQPRTIEIVGYTDNENSYLQSLTISKQWATTIMTYLVKHGVPRESITLLARGSLHPITTNYTAAGQFQNRRVEILIYM